MRSTPSALLALLLLSATAQAQDNAVLLQQVVSRHDPALNVARARLAVGLDGNVYLGSPHASGGYVLRVAPDGQTRLGGKVGYALTAVAVNRDGIVATSEAHFAHRAAFWSKDFTALGNVPDFLVSDKVQWNAPSDVCAGQSGSFYAVDQHRLRILKVTAPDKLAASFSLEKLGIQSKGATFGLRVDEKRQRFLIAVPTSQGGGVRAVGLDGQPLWSVKAHPAGEPPGGFDLDADGHLYVLSGGQETVRIFDVDGQPAGEVKLKNEQKRPGIHDLRVLGSELIVRRADATTLFEVHDRTSGELKRRVRADVDVLTARYPSAVWTAAKPVPFEIAFDAGARKTKPNFRVFLRPLGVPEFTELAVKDGAVTPPADSGGLYQVRVTPDVGGRVADYVLDGLVEIRAADAIGSVSIFTPLNRYYYGETESIPVSVVVRAGPKTKLPQELKVYVKGEGIPTLNMRLKLENGRGDFATSLRKTGRYRIETELPGFTVAPQFVEIGPGLSARPKFHIVQHGDYSLGFPPGPRPHGNLPRMIDTPETVADHLARSQKLGLNLFVDRLGHGGSVSEIGRDDALIARLKSDPLAVAPEKAIFEGSIRRTVAGYGAFGIEEQAILLYMDAGLPIGTLFDNRKPEKMDADLKQATEALRPYPAFRGWSWAANWWLEKHGADAAKDAAEKAEYALALKKAKETGAWSPILDTVSERTFAHADEVDLHYQAEQIQPPQVTPHHVDFYKLMTNRVPVVEKLKLTVPPGHVVHDVFAGRQVKTEDGWVTCDLRSLPARVYAILPAGMEPPASGTKPVEDLFGPHIRDLAISTDGKTALLNAFNWDHNLYAIDLATGETKWRNRVGHSYAYQPIAHKGGFAVQGFDLLSAEGYHLYMLDQNGKTTKRYALFGLPNRATGWASAGEIQEPGINSFTVSPSGEWMAAGGNLGYVVFDKNGKEQATGGWWDRERHHARMLALNDDTVARIDRGYADVDVAVDAYNHRPGEIFWSITLSSAGTVRGATLSSDRKMLVIHTDALGGRLYVIRRKQAAAPNLSWRAGAQLINTIPIAADEVAISSNGSFLAVTHQRQLKAIDPETGLLWTFTGDDTLRHPQISPDGQRIAVASELGTLFVLDRSGTVLAQQDVGALPALGWLPDGDLLAATWMGQILRFDQGLKKRWQTKLTPAEGDVRPKLLARDRTPTVRRTLTGHGFAEAKPLPLTPNLLAETKAIIAAVHSPKTHGDPRPWQNKIDMLFDGKPDAPPRPWLEWTDIGYIDSGWRSKLTLEVDTFRTQIRLKAVTFVEDRAHPESWLRDMRLEWWDAKTEAWKKGPMLLSDMATHSHVLREPIEAAKFRFVSSGGGTWPVGNIRLGELVFHGEVLGSSHPDAVAKKPVAVLFDENEADLNCLKHPGAPFGFRYDGAFSGGKCLELKDTGHCGPNWLPPFGHAIPNWDFEIAENPKPGQYRYLRFAWKATSQKTTGMSLLLGRAWPGGGVAATVGELKWNEGVLAEQRLPGKPPAKWQEVTVDLWKATNGKPPRIQALCLRSIGGGALFDRIVLARSEADLSAK